MKAVVALLAAAALVPGVPAHPAEAGRQSTTGAPAGPATVEPEATAGPVAGEPPSTAGTAAVEPQLIARSTWAGSGS
ncbi:hypothetical protein [Actinoplanes xinjiangensis]|uniref:Uncharacterized protein n=1 Tax=Actinoplanes xinjiangensis TaxID=512350 RepID=A0A316FID9_9ACTN|nr:hypothetical protein [Actinoplanes xinjiangensis]PWK48239.1 hypothetical protein BC793_106269 [Actinoplanes xinjiangensis]